MKKSRSPSELIDLFKKKGIISTNTNKQSTPRKSKTLTLGGLFSEILKDLTTDPEIRKKQLRSQYEDTPEEFNTFDDAQFEDEAEHERRIEEAEQHRLESLVRQEEARQRARKKLEESKKLKEHETQLEEQKREFSKRHKKAQSIIKQLKNKESLKQAIVLSEIISKPLGLR